MKNVRDFIKDKVRIVKRVVRRRVENMVCSHVRDQVWNRVQSKVKDQTWDHLYIQVKHHLYEECERLYKG